MVDLRDLLPRVLPRGWREISPPASLLGSACFVYRDGLAVLASIEDHGGGDWWLHVSCSYRDHLPSWNDLLAVKTIFIGREKEALQLLPRQSEYINEHEYCLHLWHRLAGAVVPRAG